MDLRGAAIRKEAVPRFPAALDTEGFCGYIPSKNRQRQMINCKEFTLDDLTAVTAIPVEDYTPGFSAWQLTPTIPSAAFSPTLVRAVTIGQQAQNGRLVPIRRDSGKAKDDESDKVSGRQHTVSVSCEADDREPAVWSLLLALERTPSHLLLTFRDGTRGFVQATEDTYVCAAERDGAKTSVQFKVCNTMGIQLLV